MITRILNNADDWLSGLPAGPLGDVLQGALLLVRRTLFPDIAVMPKCAKTSDKNCSGLNFDRANLAELDLSGVNFTRASFISADLTNANLNRAVLDHADLSYDVDLSGAQLVGASLRDAAMIDGVNLTGANLTGADLTGAILQPLDGGFANLTDANLTRANLTDSRLGAAVLTRGDLTDANLTGADLSLADLTGATLTGANLADVLWRDTTCPNGSKTSAGCDSAVSNTGQGIGNYQFHWEATWIRTWYDPAHHEWYDYSASLPQRPTFNYSNANGDYTASFTHDEGGDHFRIRVNSNSSGNMFFNFEISSPMRITAINSPRSLRWLDIGTDPPDLPRPDSPGIDHWWDAPFKVGDVLDPSVSRVWTFEQDWIGWFGSRRVGEISLDLEPVQPSSSLVV